MEKMMNDRMPIPSAQQCTASLQAINDALYVVGGKWRLPIIISLSEGKKRFNELHRAIEGVSAKVLSNELKALEINGFLRKTNPMDNPSVIEYELTGYSDTLQDIMNALSAWGAMHRQNLKNFF
ncbi:transcriptional regulator [Mucilaginibacter sp. MD40]|uniref:winged helix-turn-helix transcriptional regulator n=1 Tax=Mucilaginibacter sp. MD40 TaxID=2029590 RepID=UPI000BACB825|nr:helix-turn-helix domain-containing protein [Mucilaginibacter sp. MD40]PAW92310.1 transcriptional regulator [Mucilaginibacter sp. MD40]